MSDESEWAKDKITTYIDIYFDWKDRIKILLGRVVYVTVKTDTENLVGKLQSNSRISVACFWPRHRAMFAVETSASPPLRYNLGCRSFTFVWSGMLKAFKR